MGKVKPFLYSLGDHITLIDTMEGGRRGRTGCYVIQGEQVAIIETGTSHGIPFVLEGIKELKVNPEHVRYIVVTHIHLDHSGGVGSILPHFPNATIVVHKRGARHLVDPSRLIIGARSIYGDDLEKIFGEILPVPEERVLVREDGDTLTLGNGRVLTFYDTPGHAKHHFSILDSVSQGLFTGDTVGNRYVKEYTGLDFEFIFPATSPSDFDKNAVLSSIAKLEKLGAKKIFHGHFGVTEPATVAFEKVKETVEAFDTIVRSEYSPEISSAEIKNRLVDYMKQDIEKQGHYVKDLSFLELDLTLNSEGLLYSLEKEYKTENV
jgi:glyoxylase-like metal-dependent hydrolase (beta-lactamase superfamily II)